jgi:hypothetical protein
MTHTWCELSKHLSGSVDNLTLKFPAFEFKCFCECTGDRGVVTITEVILNKLNDHTWFACGGWKRGGRRRGGGEAEGEWEITTDMCPDHIDILLTSHITHYTSHMIHHTWHMTHDTWHMTHHTWHITHLETTHYTPPHHTNTNTYQHQGNQWRQSFYSSPQTHHYQWEEHPHHHHHIHNNATWRLASFFSRKIRPMGRWHVDIDAGEIFFSLCFSVLFFCIIINI